jgi:hypothetical protein
MEFDLKQNGYKLISGKTITAENIHEADAGDIIELVNMPVSAYDHLRLRANIHQLSNVVSSHITNTNIIFEEIKKMLTVDLSNGEPKTLPIGLAVKEMYTRESGKRKRMRLYRALYENRLMIIILGAIVILGATYYWKQTWFLTALIPFVISIVKDILRK